MHAKPNIVLIMTDQQRADTIGALGSPWMQTPHLDRLVNEGTSFTNCFVTSPVCVSSRASVFLGGYPHTTNVYTNFETWEPNWVQWLANAGYHCVNIGKMHINPYDAKGGFHQRFFVENKDRPLFLEDHERALYDEWDKALKARGLEKPSRYTRVRDDRDAFLKNLGCFTWETDGDMHPDNFVGDTAVWWLEDRKADSPFFLQIGFPGPRVGFLYSEAELEITDGQKVSLSELALVESSSELLFHSPGALRGFEALLHERDEAEGFVERQSIWPLAEEKLVVYRENREILLEVFARELGAYTEYFSWTIPEGGFFTVFTFLNNGAGKPVQTNDVMIENMVMEHGLVVIPMYDFYPKDARQRDPGAGMNQLRLSFCFSESAGQQRRDDMREAVEAFCVAAKALVGLVGVSE